MPPFAAQLKAGFLGSVTARANDNFAQLGAWSLTFS